MDKQKLIIIVVILIVVLLFIDQILKAIGLKKSGADRAEENAISDLRTLPQFDPLYSKGKAFKPIGLNQSNVYAEQLRKSIRGIGTDEEIIYSTFGKLNNKMNISEVAESFYLKYKTDLRAALLSDLKDSEKVKLMQIILKNLFMMSL
jgi:hypothetical protein